MTPNRRIAEPPSPPTMDPTDDRLERFFSQSLDGFFFMMLDEPLAWHDASSKDALLG
jgi:hypothetical protein